MPVKNGTCFQHLKAGERSDSGGLFMRVTKTGSKLWRYACNFDSKQKVLALGQYPVTPLADARIKRDDARKRLAEGIDAFINRKETLWMDTVLTTGVFVAQNLRNCPSMGTLFGYMQDAIPHDSGALHFDPHRPKENFLSKSDQFCTNCIPDQLGGR